MIPIPANVKLVLGLLIIAAIGALSALAKVEPEWTWAGAAVQVLTGLELYFTVPQTVAGKAAAVKIAGSTLALVSLATMLSGCLSSTAVVPVTPDNSATVSTCEGISVQHNAFAVAGYALSAGAVGEGAVSAALPASNASGKTDLAVAGAVTAGLAGLAGVLTGLSSSTFQNDQCQQFVGPLPPTPFGAKKVDGGAP